jgi:hypothetical protein
VTDLGLIQKYTSLLSSIFSKTHYYDQLAFKDEFLKEFYEDFLNPEKAYSLMNFVYPAFRVMNKIPIEQYLKIQEESVELHYRALLVAALSIPSSLLNGLFDPHTIQDLYQSAIYLDMGLVNGNHTSYLTLKACELERIHREKVITFFRAILKGVLMLVLFLSTLKLLMISQLRTLNTSTILSALRQFSAIMKNKMEQAFQEVFFIRRFHLGKRF